MYEHRARRYIRRQWGRLLKEIIFFDIPHLNGWNRHWFAVVTFDEEQFHTIPTLTQTFLTTPTGSLQTSTSDATWNNANNKVETVGPGGSGAVTQQDTGTAGIASGGGGGAYSNITNFSFATPGTTTYQWQIGTGGASKATTVGGGAQAIAGAAGGSATWFNNATDPGNGADNTKCSAAAGGAGTTGTLSSSGAGGATTSGWGTTKNAGGRGGQCTSTGSLGTGGGGAAGPNGAGNNGQDSASASSGGSGVNNGGQGDSTSGGAAGVGSGTSGTAGTNGGAGTELGDSVHGCGGGGGGWAGGANAAQVGGSGGNYGGGGAGCKNQGSGSNSAVKSTSGAGIQGIIVLTWTPAGGGGARVPLLRTMGIGR